MTDALGLLPLASAPAAEGEEAPVASLRPTLRLAAVVGVLGLTALLLPGPIVAALLVVVTVLVGVDLRDARLVPGLGWELPETVYRSVPAVVTATLTTPGRVVRIEAPVPVAVGATVRAVGDRSWELTLSRRGPHVVQAPRVTTVGRLRLVEVRHPPQESRQVVVLPDLPTARRLARTVRRRPTGVVGSSLSGPVGRGTDFEAVREYLPDDDVRFVNWRVTARLGRPATNTFRVEEGRQVTIAVDAGRLGAVDAGPDPSTGTRLDLLCDAAATVAVTALERGDRVGLIVYDDELRVRRRPGAIGESALASLLAPVAASGADADASVLLAGIGKETGGVLVVLTDLSDASVARPLLDVLPTLQRRVQVVVLTLAEVTFPPDPPLVPLTPLQAALDTAVLIADTAGRRDALKQLRRLGVPYVSSPARGLAEAALELYEESVPRI